MPSSILNPESNTKKSAIGKSIVTSPPEIQPVVKAPTTKILNEKIQENIRTQTAKEKGLIKPITKTKTPIQPTSIVVIEQPLMRRSMGEISGGGGAGAPPEEETEATDEETPPPIVEGAYNGRNVLIIVGFSLIGWYFFNKYKK
jgi:hypothetical protein